MIDTRKSRPKFKTQYDRTEDPGITFPSETPTQQHLAESCDINYIIDRFTQTGQISHENTREPQYEDSSEIQDLHSTLSLALHAQNIINSKPITPVDPNSKPIIPVTQKEAPTTETKPITPV